MTRNPIFILVNGLAAAIILRCFFFPLPFNINFKINDLSVYILYAIQFDIYSTEV